MRKLQRSGLFTSRPQRIEYDRKGDGGTIDVLGEADDSTDNAALRKELIERIEKHKEHVELAVLALVYAQGGEYRNRDRRRFWFEALEGFAATAPNTPLLLDHWRSTREQVGHCETSAAEADGPKNDILRVRESLVCNASGSTLLVLRGPVHFSFGIHCDWAKVICSHCNDTILKCGHGFWSHAREKGKLIPITWTFTDPDTMACERSLVTVPQAAGTGVEGWDQLAAFSAEFDEFRALCTPTRRTRERNTMDLTELAGKLGLASNDDGEADGEAIVLEFKRLSAQADEYRSKFDDQAGKLAELEATIAELTATIASHEKAGRDAECSALITELAAAGYIRADGPAAGLIRECYSEGKIDYAKKLADSYRDEPAGGEVSARDGKEQRELETRQTPADAALSSKPGTPGSTAPVEPDYAAAFARLPEHIRETAGPRWTNEPERYFQCNPRWLTEFGLTV